MELIYQFRKLVRAQVLLGIVAFCIAEQNPIMLVVAGSLSLLSWYIVEGPTGKPLPRWLINLGALAAVGWLMLDMTSLNRGQIIIAMGHFTIWLQILELYANKTNRDYGLILVLSLTQMVGASILSVSVIYGVLLAAYCVLALFTVLVFHLKSVSDQVATANQQAGPEGEPLRTPRPIVGRGNRWQFRATAISVGGICGSVAVIVFLLVPRANPSGPTSLGGADTRPTTGFSPSVRLGVGAPLPGSREPIMHVAIRLHDQNVGSENAAFLVRGLALDQYDRHRFTWERGTFTAGRDVQVALTPDEGTAFAQVPDSIPILEAQFTLRSASGGLFFTLHPVTWIQSQSVEHVLFNPADQKLSAHGPTGGALVYRVRSPVGPAAGIFKQYEEIRREGAGPNLPLIDPSLRLLPEYDDQTYARHWSVQPKRVRELAEQIIAARGLARDPKLVSTPDDDAIARALRDHLATTFRYDLTNPPTPRGQDPIIEFLFANRRGHCELFAAAHVALCRSLGIPARVVNGYMAAEFNTIGSYYVIRQNNAHAWSEVYCGDEGWRKFDATPQAVVAAGHRADRGVLTGLRELYEHVQYLWLRSVVTYDRDARNDVLNNINDSITRAANDERTWIGSVWITVRNFLYNWKFDRFTYTLMAVIVVFIIIGVASIVHTLMMRRKRLVALQLTRLPRRDRRVLARELRFYLSMLELLDRYGHVRPEWQTPKGFADQLASTAPQQFAPVVELTEQFYEVRFGHRRLDDNRRTAIRQHLRQLETNLASPRV